MRDRCQPGLRDLHVVLRRVEARSDGADHLAIDHDWKPALHLDEALRGNGSNATVVDRVLERLARFLEQRGCSGTLCTLIVLANARPFWGQASMDSMHHDALPEWAGTVN